MQPLTYPLIDVPWAETRAQAVRQAFGPVTDVMHVMHSVAALHQVPPVHVLRFANRLGAGLDLLVTEGLSDATLIAGDQPARYRLELLTVVRTGDDWSANALRVVAESFVRLYGSRFMSVGETMSLSNPVAPVAAGSQLTRFAFLVPPKPIRDAAASLMSFVLDGTPMLPLWCTPVGEAELPIIDRLGHPAFGDRLEAASLAVDLCRPLLT